MDYSVIIPAHNEEHFLPATLAALAIAMENSAASGEVIVVDNASDDRTAQLASASGARVIFEAHRQIARARNVGAAAANGRFLVFLDADTLISSSLLERALEALASGSVCVGGATVDFGAAGRRHILPRVWNRISLAFKLAAGCFIYTHAEAHHAVGGFDEAYYASEEIWYVRRLKRWGKPRSMEARIFADEPIRTSDRKLHMYSTRELLGLILLSALPFSVRSRRMCALWYDDRPKT